MISNGRMRLLMFRPLGCESGDQSQAIKMIRIENVKHLELDKVSLKIAKMFLHLYCHLLVLAKLQFVPHKVHDTIVALLSQL